MLRRHLWWLAPLAGAAVAGAVVAAVSFGGGSSSHNPPRTSHAHLQPAAAALAFQRAITAVVHRLSPSVVQIQSSDGLGSGVVFDTNGDVVTNNHVVAGGGPYTVTAGAHTYGASLVGRFAPDDLAIVRVSGAKLAPAAFADSSKLAVGDFAIAIGNPLGLALERDRRHRQRLPSGRLGGKRRRATAHDPDECRDQPRQLGRRARGSRRAA